MGFGEIIKEARERAGLTQQRLGEMVGVTDVAVGYWERNQTRPRSANAQKVIDILGIDPAALLTSDPAIALAAGLEHGKIPASYQAHTAPLYDAIGASCARGEWIAVAEVPVPDLVLAEHPRGFFVRMPDASLSRVLPEGAFVFVDPAEPVVTGEIAVVVVEGDETPRVVRFLRTDNTLVLASDSPDGSYTDRVFDLPSAPVRLLGPMVWFGAPYTGRV